MPLVVPGLQKSGNNQKDSEWSNKLMGKKIGEISNETTFAKQDLPSEHRVLHEGSIMTQDYKPGRLNIQHAKDGTINRVWHG